MLKRIMWKFFPPKEVTVEQVAQAHEIFDNVRNNFYCRSDEIPFMRYLDVEDASKNFESILEARKNYVEYIKHKKS